MSTQLLTDERLPAFGISACNHGSLGVLSVFLSDPLPKFDMRHITFVAGTANTYKRLRQLQPDGPTGLFERH